MAEFWIAFLRGSAYDLAAMMGALFVSHSSKDRALAEEIAQQLNREFVAFFLDFDPERGIPVGRNWEREIYHRLLSCAAVLFLVSPASVGSKWCFAEPAQARALGRKILPVKVAECELPDIIRDIEAIDLCGEPSTAYDRLWAELRRLSASDEGGFVWDGTRSPYPGIFSFDFDDAAIFFGRNEESRRLVSLLERIRSSEGRLAIVIGASGTGKSSLVRTGLLPRLGRKPAEWILLKPVIAGPGLLEELAERLSSLSKASCEPQMFDVVYGAMRKSVSEPGRLEGSAFASVLRAIRLGTDRADAHFVAVIDQVERLLGNDAMTSSALQFLGNCARSSGLPLELVLTLRSDHLDPFQTSGAMSGVRFETFPLAPLLPDRFGEVIEGPARLVDLQLGPGLVSTMVVAASRRDGLPLLAFALRELFDKFGCKSNTLTLDNYQHGLGGLEGCIGSKAREAMASLKLAEQDTAELRKTLCCMARLTESETFVGQPITWALIPDRIRPAIEKLIDERLFVSHGERGTVEVAHEVLLRAWDDLRGWLQAEVDFLRWQRDLRPALQEWEHRRQDSDQVHLSGALLKEAQGWLDSRAGSMSDSERAFVEASLNRAQTEERRWHRAFQESLARQLGAKAPVIIGYEAPQLADRALLIAVEAMRRCAELGIQSLEADQALRQALALQHDGQRTFRHCNVSILVRSAYIRESRSLRSGRVTGRHVSGTWAVAL